MFTLLLCFLYAVSASHGAYSRIFLRGLKTIEIERIQTDLIYRGTEYIEQAIFIAAKKGLLEYTTEPFLGCDAYTIPSEASPLIGINKELCKNIISGIRTSISERFPDSEILYNPTTKQYTLKWD